MGWELGSWLDSIGRVEWLSSWSGRGAVDSAGGSSKAEAATKLQLTRLWQIPAACKWVGRTSRVQGCLTSGDTVRNLCNVTSIHTLQPWFVRWRGT